MSVSYVLRKQDGCSASDNRKQVWNIRRCLSGECKNSKHFLHANTFIVETDDGTLRVQFDDYKERNKFYKNITNSIGKKGKTIYKVSIDTKEIEFSKFEDALAKFLEAKDNNLDPRLTCWETK